jgi:hypothetical protein
MVISGMSQSGKSTLTGQLLIRRNEMICTPDGSPIHSILYCYTEYQPRFFQYLQQHIPKIQFCKGLPESFHDGTDRPSIVVLDDLMNEASKSTDTLAAFTRASHHRNVSIIILVQNFFHRGLRGITSSCKYCIIMKNPRDSAAFCALSRQMNAGRKNFVMDDAYAQCMKIPYGYLFIDCTQNQNDNYRLRNSIFPENCIVFTK